MPHVRPRSTSPEESGIVFQGAMGGGCRAHRRREGVSWPGGTAHTALQGAPGPDTFRFGELLEKPPGPAADIHPVTCADRARPLV